MQHLDKLVLRTLRLLMVLLAAAAASACGSDKISNDDDDDPDPPVVDTVPSPATEARVAWISRFDWLNEAELTALIDSLAAANFNMIYFQARGRADAFYNSHLEPWAHRPPAFNLGQNPGWDPLAVALSRARANNLQLHVWINAMIGWCGSEAIPETQPRHVLLQHPKWVMVDKNGNTTGENCKFLTPGEPGVRTWVARVAADIVRSYAVDGIHLDYIRYPDESFSFDSATQAAYAAARVSEPFLTYPDHLRRLITATVREVRDSIRAARPRSVLSAAVWGVYRNTAGWSNVAAGFDTRFQDSRDWLQSGTIDAIAPMIYWNIKPTFGERLDFAWLAEDFAKSKFSRHVYIGMGVESASENFCLGCDVVTQIYQARRAGGHGVTVYNARLLRDKRLWNALRTGPFKAKVPPPTLPWL